MGRAHLEHCSVQSSCRGAQPLSCAPHGHPSTAAVAPTFPWWTHAFFPLLPKRSFFWWLFYLLFSFLFVCFLYLLLKTIVFVQRTLYLHSYDNTLAHISTSQEKEEPSVWSFTSDNVFSTCLYTLTMMAHNYGLLWSSITAAFFLPKDPKKRQMNDSAGYSSMLLYGLIMKKTRTMIFQAIAYNNFLDTKIPSTNCLSKRHENIFFM